MPNPSPHDSESLRVEAQARLAAIIESSDDAIISKTLDGVITTWNKGAERIFGYTEAEAIGRSITMLIPPDRQDEEPKILARIGAGQRVDHFETVRVTKDGRLLDVSVTISPVRDATGRIIGASKVARDVTEQRRTERALRAAMEAAESANRAKDRFLSVLSHELRTPLTPVLAAISHIESAPEMPPEVLHEQVGMIRRNIETQVRLVDDLLDLTRISRGKVQLRFEVTDAHAAVRAVLAMLQSDVEEKRLAVTTALRATDHHVWADSGRLQQVFLHLLSNAIKFTPPDGSITLASTSHNGRFGLELADTGVGIDPALMPRLFTPFEQGEKTVQRQFGGLGLGLSIVKSVINLHGGRVSASSAGVGKGATFVVELDNVVIPDANSAASKAARGSPSRVKAGQRILLVEDHVDTRRVMSRLLASFGFVVSTAGTVREALDLAQRERFDLLVSDIGLPDGSGTDLMRELKGRHPIRGIALSGFGQDDDLRRSAEAGFERHLTKPVNFQTLREVILDVAN